MIRHFSILTAIGLVLSACASTPSSNGPVAWNGSSQHPNKHPRHKQSLAKASLTKPDPDTEKEKILATLRPYSREWFVLHDEIEAEEDKRIKGKLVICRGCFSKPDEDFTGSLHRN
jgi:hypothetical protein